MTTKNIQFVLQSLPNLPVRKGYVDESDNLFLRDYMEHFINLFQVQEMIENSCDPIETNIQKSLLADVTKMVRKISKKNKDAAKLLHILKKLNFKALIDCLYELNSREYVPVDYEGSLVDIQIESDYEEDVIQQDFVDNENQSPSEFSESEEDYDDDDEPVVNKLTKFPANMTLNEDDPNFQIVGIARDRKQPLGITVTKHDFEHKGQHLTRCCVERILVNSLIDKQDIMQVGDILFEVNNVPVETPEELQSLISKAANSITFKILKTSSKPPQHIEKTYTRALFDYDPSKDALLPAESIGMPFKSGDVMEVINRDDPDFWQALPLNSTNAQALLIPSQALQERRLAVFRPPLQHGDSTVTKGKHKKNRKSGIFRAQDAADITSEMDLRTYEEVVKFPPSRVPCLILIGPTGIGKKAIKHQLVKMEPYRFAFPVQDSTEKQDLRKSRSLPLFNHVDRSLMETDVKSCQYVCVEEKDGELYGIRITSIRDLIIEGKTVVLDCKPKDIYTLYQPVFNPYVIMLAAPSINVLESMQKEGLQKGLTKNKRSTNELQDIINESAHLEELCKSQVNAVVINSGVNDAVQEILDNLSIVESQESWIPAAWEYDITPLNKVQLIDNSDVSNTMQRRYEKKPLRNSVGNVKPLPSKQPNQYDPRKQQDYANSSDEEEEDESESEGEQVVMAKPVKYVNPIPPKANEQVVIEEQPMPVVKPTLRQTQSKSVEVSVTKPVVKQHSVFQSKGGVDFEPEELSGNLVKVSAKQQQNAQIRLNEQDHIDSAPVLKNSKNAKPNENSIKQVAVMKQPKVSAKASGDVDNDVKLKAQIITGKPSISRNSNRPPLQNNPSVNKEPPAAPTRQKSVELSGGGIMSVDAKVSLPKVEVSSSVQKPQPQKVITPALQSQKPIPPQQQQQPPARSQKANIAIRRKEPSSSSMSDTSSEEYIKENRV